MSHINLNLIASLTTYPTKSSKKSINVIPQSICIVGPGLCKGCIVAVLLSQMLNLSELSLGYEANQLVLFLKTHLISHLSCFFASAITVVSLKEAKIKQETLLSDRTELGRKTEMGYGFTHESKVTHKSICNLLVITYRMNKYHFFLVGLQH